MPGNYCRLVNGVTVMVTKLLLIFLYCQHRASRKKPTYVVFYGGAQVPTISNTLSRFPVRSRSFLYTANSSPSSLVFLLMYVCNYSMTESLSQRAYKPP